MGNNSKYLLAVPAALALLTWNACKKAPENGGNTTPADSSFHGLHVDYMDTTASPGQSFWNYANGKFLSTTQIPDEYSSWGAFQMLDESNTKILRGILESAANDKAAEAGSVRVKIGDFWATGMDSAKIEQEGLKPIQAQLDQIEAITDNKGVVDMIVWMHMRRMAPLFYLYADQDAKNNTQVVPNMGQAGLGLPDREYYLSPDYADIRPKYVEHIGNMLKLSGMEEAAARTEAENIMKLETQLATSSMDIVSQRDPNKTYNKVDLKGLQTMAPNFDWQAYFTGIGLTYTDVIIVGQPDFFKAMSGLMRSQPIGTWKSYLRWNLISASANKLNKALVDEDFRFNEGILSGTPKIRPRWKRVIESANYNLGEALGQEYVKVAFSPEAKTKALEMVQNILGVMKDRLANLEWMSPETRAQAIKKVETIMPKIGYPDKWRDFNSLTTTRNSWIENVFACHVFNYKYNLSKIGKPVDKTEWGMPPQIVNAYYNPLMNEIVFPAGILQPPFFDVKVDDALNYGGFGAVIGHELIHAFDDQGSQFDAEGNLKNWWTEADRKNFMARAQKVVEQYNAYIVLDSLHVNGMLTLGENIADIDGLRISLEALGRANANKRLQPIDGFNATQRFFINYAHIWASKMRDEALRTMIATNPHSPAMYRVIGSVSNRPEFYNAFNVKEGDPMWRADSVRIVIW